VLPLRPTYQTIYRRRSAHAVRPETATAEISDYLESRFGQLRRETLIFPVQISETTPEKTELSTLCEERLLAIGSPEMIYLQILSIVGLLLITLALSFTVVRGWEIKTEPLAPGESFRNVQHDFELAYHVVTPVTENDKLVTHLEAHIGDAVERLSVAAKSFMRIDAVGVWAETDQPALLVSSIGETPLLARSGQFSPSARIGLLFPTSGSEESVILPRQRIGLRIVRMPDPNLPADEKGNYQNTVALPNFLEDDIPAFMVEVFREPVSSAGNVSNAQALERYYIGNRLPTTLPVDGLDVLIRLDPMPSLRVEAYYRPNLWLTWPAFVMVLIGLIGFWRQPRFLVIQIGPWPTERAVVVIQGNVVDDVDDVEAWLDEQVQDIS